MCVENCHSLLHPTDPLLNFYNKNNSFKLRPKYQNDTQKYVTRLLYIRAASVVLCDKYFCFHPMTFQNQRNNPAT
jgi:hypothetical protein